MRIAVYTADFAQADERGKLNAIGLGWSTVEAPLPPHSVAVIFTVEWNEANEKFQFVLELVDEDGHAIAISEDGVAFPIIEPDSEIAPVVRVEGALEVGRPPGVAKGTEFSQTIAITLPGGLPLEAGKRYQYRVQSGDVTESHTFAVVSMF